MTKSVHKDKYWKFTITIPVKTRAYGHLHEAKMEYIPDDWNTRKTEGFYFTDLRFGKLHNDQKWLVIISDGLPYNSTGRQQIPVNV